MLEIKFVIKFNNKQVSISVSFYCLTNVSFPVFDIVSDLNVVNFVLIEIKKLRIPMNKIMLINNFQFILNFFKILRLNFWISNTSMLYIS